MGKIQMIIVAHNQMILLTRGIHSKIQSIWVTSRNNNNQGHIFQKSKYWGSSYRIDITPWLALHILEIEGRPFNYQMLGQCISNSCHDMVKSKDISFRLRGYSFQIQVLGKTTMRL